MRGHFAPSIFLQGVITLAEESICQKIKETIHIVDYAASLGYTPIRQGNFYTLKEHDSVKINAAQNTYKRYSTGEWGGVIDFCMNMQGISQDAAIKELAAYVHDGRISSEQRVIPQKELPKKAFMLPPKHDGPYTRVFSYLCHTRGIDYDVVMELVKRKMLYEDAEHHNAVFVGYDYDGIAKYGFKKSTNPDRKFAIDVEGNQKYPVGIWIDNKSNSVVVGEAIIDLMSVMTITKMNGSDYKAHNYYSMQGNNTESVKYHLEHNPHITQLVLAVDNDAAGDKYRDKIKKLCADMNWHGKIFDRRPRLNDFNDVLKESLKSLPSIESPEKED